MIWWFQWGDKVEALQELRSRGLEVPALDNAPQLPPDEQIFWRSYCDCSTERRESGAIPFSAVATWCELYGEPLEEHWDVIRIADAQVRKWKTPTASASSAKPRT